MVCLWPAWSQPKKARFTNKSLVSQALLNEPGKWTWNVFGKPGRTLIDCSISSFLLKHVGTAISKKSKSCGEGAWTRRRVLEIKMCLVILQVHCQDTWSGFRPRPGAQQWSYQPLLARATCFSSALLQTVSYRWLLPS